ncbi:MAG: tyrosine-type recombinase/integrase [Proteobacteria bacterium]|nr:tyrosine-type recombinase/integrase [Pseudomonadota bacterium]
MPKMKLTKRAIDDLQPGDKDAFFWDADITGLAVKVTPKGKKTFMVQYRPGGRGSPTRKIFIGPFGEVTLHKARTEAKRIFGLRAEGRDPALERQQAKQRAISNKFADIAADFLAKHASQNRTVDETARILKRDVLPKWGKRSIHEIGKRDVNDLLDVVVARGSHVMANRTLANLRKLFNWCVSRGIITASPCEGISAPHREKARDRVLSDDELIAIFNAAKQMGGAFGAIIQMLILTAQRRNEVSEMTWNELDLNNDIWTIPGSRTKNEKPHFVHLSEQASAVLSSVLNVGAFTFTSNGKTPFSGFSKAKKRLDELSGVTDWRLHDIRRTVTSGMAQLGIAPHVADKILNHQSGTISGVAAVYQRHEFLDDRKTALNAWGNYVQSLLEKSDRDNVVNIHDR